MYFIKNKSLIILFDISDIPFVQCITFYKPSWLFSHLASGIRGNCFVYFTVHGEFSDNNLYYYKMTEGL